MKHTAQIAKHLREIYFGGNWTWSSLRETLSDVSWIQANKKIEKCNSILALTFHINYYVKAVSKVLQKSPLDSKDALSFDHPKIGSQEEWESFIESTYAEANDLASMIEILPEEKLWEVFVDDKYGNYYRNFHGLIEHTHYHLGQIVILKKIIANENATRIS